MTTRERRMIIIVVFLCAVLLWSVYILKPYLNDNDKYSSAINSLKISVDNSLQQQKILMKKLQNSVSKSNNDIKYKFFKKTNKVSILINKIFDLSKKNNIEILDSVSGSVINDAKYTKYNILKIKISGTYQGIFKYLNSLENADYFIAVDNIKIQIDNKDKLIADLILTTYILN